jgi:hypothetical protein
MTTTSKPFIVKDDFIVDNAPGRQMVIPLGDSNDRPDVPIPGTIRYNGFSQSVEIFNPAEEWQSVANSGEAVTTVTAEEIALVQSIIFG